MVPGTSTVVLYRSPTKVLGFLVRVRHKTEQFDLWFPERRILKQLPMSF